MDPRIHRESLLGLFLDGAGSPVNEGLHIRDVLRHWREPHASDSWHQLVDESGRATDIFQVTGIHGCMKRGESSPESTNDVTCNLFTLRLLQARIEARVAAWIATRWFGRQRAIAKKHGDKYDAA